MNTAKKYISTTDTAKLIRTALKEAFPGITFSVKSRKYSGGSSIDISWTDGPTSRQVDQITGNFSGASFDGMIDLKSYHDTEFNGELVHFCADYVNTRREFTQEFMQTIADRTCRYWGRERVVVFTDKWGSVNIPDDQERLYGPNTLRDLIWQAASRTFFFNGMMCWEKR